MSHIETPGKPEAVTAILAIALFVPLMAGVFTNCDGFGKKSSEVTVQNAPPPAPMPVPVPVPVPNPNPVLLNQWIALNSVTPPAARAAHSAVWTGSKMIIWGGQNAAGVRADGAALDPLTGVWTPIQTVGAPPARFGHTANWNGTRMVLWGGTNGTTYYKDGYSYDPVTNAWAAITGEDDPMNSPAARASHSMVYDGQTFLLWGGGSAAQPNGYIDGGNYLLNGFWNLLTGAAPVLARIAHSAVWTGSKMIMFGGQNNGITSQDGFIYDPITRVFAGMSVAANTPSNRSGHAAVWTGSKMVVWGGLLQGITTSYYGDGRIYDYATTGWSVMAIAGAPVARAGHSAVWAGDAMIIWGGTSGPAAYYNTGAVFH